jgi:hypothetical protein
MLCRSGFSREGSAEFHRQLRGCDNSTPDLSGITNDLLRFLQLSQMASRFISGLPDFVKSRSLYDQIH